MKTRLNFLTIAGLAILALSSFLMNVANAAGPASSASVLGTADAVRGLATDLCTSNNQNCYNALNAPPPSAQNQAGLGNRIGTFSTSPQSTGYIRATTCLFAGSGSNDDRNTSFLRPIAGPYSDGSYVWQLTSSGSVEDNTLANCYFNGNAGFFSSSAFNNYDNMTSSTTRVNVHGYYMQSVSQISQLDFVTGASRSLDTQYGPEEYSPCEVNYYSAECQAILPPPPPPPEQGGGSA